jgi:acetolactate synthase-1/2/3 large subunit
MSTVKAPAATAVSRPPAEKRIASYLLTEYLEQLGVEVIFGLCGHTVIALLDALGKSRIRYVSTRHEQIAAHAADGYARASGKVGVVMTHLGPGLTNAATGVANAALDSIPMVVLAGDVPSHFHGRHPHQEVNLHQDADQFQIFRPFCKRVYRVDRVEDLPRIVERAFHLAQTGRPGPVLVDIPMDILSADLAVEAFDKTPPEIARTGLDPAIAARIVDALAAAQRPVLYAGGGVLSANATAELTALAEALEVPVAHTLMGKGCLHHDHPLLLGQSGFWGTPIANDRCRTADVIVAIGTRLAEANSSSWDPRFTFSIPPTRLMHIDADLSEIGRNYQTELGVVADAKLALAALAEAARGRSHADRGRLRDEIARGRRAFSEHWAGERQSDRFPLRPERILDELRRAAPEDAFIVTDVGWNKNGVGQQFPITVPGTFITPSGLATMGFGPAAALGVKTAQPHRHAIALVGDGGFSANPSVIATAMEANLPVIWIVMDNSAFGTIAGLEEMHYGTTFGCVFECDGRPYRVDYAAMARSFGADGVMVTRADDLGPALGAALASGRPTLIQVPMENAPTPTPGHWDINDIYRKGE